METEISGHNNDIIMKATAAMFKDKTLEVFGLKTAKIVDIMPTVLPVVEVKEKRVDFVFLLETIPCSTWNSRPQSLRTSCGELPTT